MTVEEPYLRRAIVLASALVYWGGVWFQARRVRRHIGRSPNVRPRGLKERLLWSGWCLIAVGWMALAFVIRPDTGFILTRLQSSLLHPTTLVAGLLLIVSGYAGTLWCYASMGDRWRMGIDREERNTLVTRGPYAAVRHPIYSFQLLMLAGAGVLLPAGLPATLLCIHLLCIWIKALDEEAYLLKIHGNDYRAYMERTGRLLPPLARNL